ANWMKIAGGIRAWTESVIRTTVAVASVEESALQGVSQPTLLINARDDKLCPLLGSEMLRSSLQTSVLHVPEFGGHDSLVLNDAALERLVRFLVAEESMLFAEDSLFTEQLVSRWNLPGDKAFMRYYQCGLALSQ
ncbi:unnamed protein product, partial [Polarella glacialis]